MASPRARRAAYVAAALASLVLVAIAVVPLLVPPKTVRRLVLQTLDRGCGCTVAVRGRFALTLWPEPGLLATRLRVADPPGFAPEPLLRVRRVVLRASWGGLLRGRWALASVRLRGVVLTLTRDARGGSNLSAFLHAHEGAARERSERPVRKTTPPSFLAVFGRLVVHGFDVIGEPGGRLLASVPRLSLGPESRRGLPVSLAIRLPLGGKHPLVGSLRGTLVTEGVHGEVLDLAALTARAPSLFPGVLSAGPGRVAYLRLPGGEGGDVRIGSFTLSDPRLGRAALQGTIGLVGTKIARASGSLHLRLRSVLVRRRLPWLRPLPGRSGVRAVLTVSDAGDRFGPAPFALAWTGRRGRVRLAGSLAGLRRPQGWCWSLRVRGSGLGLRLPKPTPARPSPSGKAPAATAAVRRVPPARRVSPTSRMCLTLHARLADVALDGIPVPHLLFHASVTGRRVLVPNLAAEAFMGRLEGHAQGRLAGRRLRGLAGELTFRGVELARIQPVLDPGAGAPLAGRVSGTATLAAHGGLGLRRWEGSGTVAGSGLVWRGVDLVALLHALGSAVHGRLPARWPSGGATSLGTLRAAWTLSNDRVALRGIDLESPLLHVTGGGRVGLAGPGRMDLALDLAPGPRADARTWPPALRGIVIPVHVGGSLIHPRPLPDVPVILHRLLRRRLGGLLGRFLGRG